MILTAIVAGIIGVWIGFTLACVVRVGGQSDDWAAWVEQQRAEDGNDELLTGGPTNA